MLISLGWAVWETLVQVKSLFNLFFGACVSVLRTLNSSKYKRLISLLHFIPFPLCQTWQHLGPRHHPGHPLATPAARLRGCVAARLRLRRGGSVLGQHWSRCRISFSQQGCWESYFDQNIEQVNNFQIFISVSVSLSFPHCWCNPFTLYILHGNPDFAFIGQVGSAAHTAA